MHDILDNKVCVITGGAGSVGLAMARAFHAQGALLILVDQVAVDNAVLASLGGASRVITLIADVSDEGQTRDYAARALAAFGRIDVLVSNAGNLGVIAPIAQHPVAAFDAVWAVHVRGAFLACKHITPVMSDGGSIIIVSSVAGVRGNAGPYGYVTAKHAQVGLMRALAKEMAPRRIRVNTLHPGPLDNAFQAEVEVGIGRVTGQDGAAFFNKLIPLGRHGHPDEIAQSALYLASDMSSFTTGTVLMADGGMAS